VLINRGSSFYCKLINMDNSFYCNDNLREQRAIKNLPKNPDDFLSLTVGMKFFVIGDPGRAGLERVAVAEGMASLQTQWREENVTQASFVISTGQSAMLIRNCW
jgi:hypothetical protein